MENKQNEPILKGNEENNEEEGKDSPRDIIYINDRARTIIYICLVTISAFSACDGGILPQQIEKVKEDFEVTNNSTIGFFNSVDYIGRVLGGFIFAIIMGKINRKMLLVSTLIFKAITLLIALFTKDKIVNIIFRGLSGISQVFFTTYLPVWCDQYGKETKRTMMVTFVQLGASIGIIFGYGLGLICEKLLNGNDYHGWRLAFGIEGIILIICAFIIFSFKNQYFSCNFTLIKDNEGREEEKKNESNFLSNLGKIICNKLFLFTTLSYSVAFFGMSIIQFWGDNYMSKVLKMEDAERFIAVGVLCLLGPMVGLVFGGLVTSKLGGYGKKKAMFFLIILIIIASFVSEATALIEQKYIYIILTWFFLFFICATIPPESGIIISSLENNLRGDGFALCNCILNLIGNFPAAYVFSILSDLFKNNFDKNEIDSLRYALGISLGYNFIGLVFVIIAGIFRFKIKGDLSKDEIKNIDKEDLGRLNESTSVSEQIDNSLEN